jgi:amidohydrolase
MNIKDVARGQIEKVRQPLIELSHRIHAHPELGFEEEKACGWVCEILDRAGFKVERGICDLPTAFAARAGSGPLHLTICAEYDCLPAIGHACGHNVIAAMAAGAGIALAKTADDAGLSVTVLGTPAEEICNAGGKILLLERGAFEGTHFAMMAHPAPFDMAAPPFIAVCQFEARYTGKEAHASAFPELGINAADALVVAQTAIGLLRQHIHQTDRIHGIVTHGGEAPNIVPAHTSAKYMVRARNVGGLHDIRSRVLKCFEAGAIATGARLEIVGGDKPYAEVLSDTELAAIYRRNGEALGRRFISPSADLSRAAASTDMGNVSLIYPTIHPIIGIDSLPAVNHQPEFTAACITRAADQALFDGSIAMAWTALDAAADPNLRARLMNAHPRHPAPAGGV